MLFSHPSQAIPINYNLNLSIGSEDNTGIDPEFFKSISIEANYFKGLSRSSVLVLSGEVTSIDYNDSTTRDGAIFEIEAKFSYVPDPGYTRPTYSISIRQTESDNIDKSTTALILTSSIRLDEEISLLGGFKISESKSDQDASQVGVFVNFDYKPSDNLTLYATYSLVDEETDAMTDSTPRAEANLRGPIASHHTCAERGDCAPAAGADPTDFDNTTFTLGTSYKIASQHLIDFAYDHFIYEPKGGDNTTSDVFTANYYYLF